jgi:hypothetical protein
MLVERHRRSLAGRSARDEKVHVLLNLPVHECAESLFVYLAAFGERRDKRRTASGKETARSRRALNGWPFNR